MKRSLITALILVATTLGCMAQANKWKSYLSYYDVTHIEPAGSSIFVLASNAIFSYNLNDQSIKEYGQSDGLSSNNIARIAWSKSAKELIIVYEDLNIDVLDTEGNIVNIASYKTKYTTDDKTINDIYIDGIYAYMATGFGVVKINLRDKVIDNTYRLSANISSVVVKDNVIYAMCLESETLYIGKQTDNLLDSSAWSKRSAPVSNHLFVSDGAILGFSSSSNIETINGRRFIEMVYTIYQYNITNSSITTKNIMEVRTDPVRYSSSSWVEPTYAINCNDEHIIFSKDNKAHEVYGTTYESYDLPEMECLTYDNTNKCYWVCSSTNKAISQMKKQSSAESGESSSPFSVTLTGIAVNNPKYNWYYSLRYHNGSIIGTDGGLAGNPTNWMSETEGRKPAIQMLRPDGSWLIFEDDVKQYTNITYSDICCVDIDPLDSSRVVVGSRSGVYEFVDGKFSKHWTITNSPLKSALSTNLIYVEVTGVVFDDKGDLWVLNGYTNNCILKLTHDGVWENHTPQELEEITASATRNARHPQFDSKGRLWFCIDHSQLPSVYCYNPTTEELLSFQKPFVNQDGTDIHIVNGIHALAIDKEDNVWIGTDAGLFMLPANSQIPGSGVQQVTQIKIARNDGTNFADYLLADTDISYIAIDGANRKWIGTYYNGVYLVSSDNKEVLLHFTKDDSQLLSDYVESIAINSNTGEVFFGTQNGLCSYMSDATQTYDEMTSDNVRAYPNPVHPDYVGVITITGLTLNADVKIVSPNGNLVAEGRSNGGSFEWDGRDQSGHRVASGVYMVLTATSDGKKGVVCKVAIVN
ncbi:MAG: hypothetical protein K5893_11455 [Prevotella sp.]|nr:hypothetical protein [Prevotella sp.]